MSSNNPHFILPKIGEYAYFDSRLKNNVPHFIINTENKESCGCHYSLNYKKDTEAFVTCHGIIVSIPTNPHNDKISILEK